MALLLFIVFGFVIGLVARALMPGDQKMGFLMTTVLGIAGSFIGGFLGALVSNRQVFEFHTAGIIGSLIGALVLLAIGGGMLQRRTLG